MWSAEGEKTTKEGQRRNEKISCKEIIRKKDQEIRYNERSKKSQVLWATTEEKSWCE